MAPNISSNIGPYIPNMVPSMNQTMAPNMTGLVTPNDTYMNIPYPTSLPMMNHDWHRNSEANYWSPDMHGPNDSTPKRFFRFESPINKIGESSYNNNTMKNNWIQQQMCNKRQVFGPKQNNESNCPIIPNDQNVFGQHRDVINSNKAVFNNKQIYKGIWGRSDNAVKHTFGHINNSEEFETPYTSPKRQKVLPNANVRYFNGNSFAYQPDYNYSDLPKVSPQKLTPFPIIDMRNLSKSMENVLNFKDNSKNFLTPQTSSDAFRSYGIRNLNSAENFFLKDSRIVQKKTPTKLNVQLFPSTGSSFTETYTTAVTPSKLKEVTEKIPQKNPIYKSNKSELISKSPKLDVASDLRQVLIAKRRKLNSNDAKMESANTTKGKFYYCTINF